MASNPPLTPAPASGGSMKPPGGGAVELAEPEPPKRPTKGRVGAGTGRRGIAKPR